MPIEFTLGVKCVLELNVRLKNEEKALYRLPCTITPIYVVSLRVGLRLAPLVTLRAVGHTDMRNLWSLASN